jgi:hypothetical protein
MLDLLGPTYLAVMALLGAVAVLAVVRAAVRLRRGEPGSALSNLLLGSAFGLGALLMVSLGTNLLTYQRLTRELPVATLTLHQAGPGYFAVDLATADGRYRALDLRGDEWQLDARILKWHGIATVLGLDTLYRLERLSGRYRDAEQQRNAPRTVHELAAEGGGLDPFVLAERVSWLPLVDAVYGNATYLPAADGASYAVTVSTTGLVARPLNEAARRAIAGWH